MLLRKPINAVVVLLLSNAVLSAQRQTDPADWQIRQEREKASDANARELANFGRPNEAEVQRHERIRKDQFEKFRAAFKEFQSAQTQFGESLAAKASLKESLQSLGKSTDIFLDFIKLIDQDRPHFDSTEFKGFTTKDLSWELLTSAERITPDLEAVIRSESSSTVDFRYMASLNKLQKDLLRLRWLTRKLG